MEMEVGGTKRLSAPMEMEEFRGNCKLNLRHWD